MDATCNTGWRPRPACSPPKIPNMDALPQAPSTATERTPNRGPVSPAQLILVVDDDALIRRLIARTLLSSGYQVDTAEDGVAGWEAIQAEPYDLLLTDHNMPGVTGVELTQMLWSARLTLPVILVTGAPLTEELEQHPWLKFSAILVKPFSAEELLATVKAALCAPDDSNHHAGAPHPIAAGGQFRPPSRWGLNE
jgi:DNA-binding response OmpR family regulator